MNGEERASVERREEYNDRLHLPNDKLTCTSTIERAIPTPTVDHHRAINVKYRIPKIHREELETDRENASRRCDSTQYQSMEFPHFSS